MADVKLGRYRVIPYTVRWAGRVTPFEWSGMKGNKVDIKTVPEELVQYLEMNTTCFKDGELKIIEDTEETKEIVDNISDKKEYIANTLSREDSIKLLNGNYKKLESQLKTMNKDSVANMVDIAKEIKLDSATKQKILADALGVPVDIAFEEN